jgi:group I intron endonuclease
MERRARGGRAYSGCTAFYKAIQKYGWDNFTHEVLESGLSYDDACEKERHYIKLFHSLISEMGYNLETGGGANTSVNEETKKKISEKLTGRKGTPHTPESKKKLSEARRGKKMPPRSEESRRKLSQALKGRTFTPEHRAKISKSKSGAATSGKNNSHPRAVLCVETGVIFDTIKEAGEFKGGSSKNIIACCRGRLNTSGGYHWRYADEEV